MLMFKHITPVMYVDPSGEFVVATIIIVSLIIGAFAGGFELAMQHSEWLNNGANGDFWARVDWFAVGIEATSAAIFTALTMVSLGSSTAASSSWYLYSRLALSGTMSVLRGINEGASITQIATSTIISLGLTYAFVRVGARPMSTSILDSFTNYNIINPLIFIQICRQTAMEAIRYFSKQETWDEINSVLEYDYAN